MADFRRENLGFVFQEFQPAGHLFPARTTSFCPWCWRASGIGKWSGGLRPLPEKLGITQLLKKYPYEVSGGQKQRAAVARALITAAPAGAGRRAHRRAGFQGDRRAAAAVFDDINRAGADHPDGDPLRQGGQSRRPGAVHQGRRGISSDLPRRQTNDERCIRKSRTP